MYKKLNYEKITFIIAMSLKYKGQKYTQKIKIE